MGNICDCFKDHKPPYEPTSRTPLLSAQSGPVNSQPATNNVGSSARRNKLVQQELASSLEHLTAISLAPVKTVATLDKTFQDHSKLYNDLYNNFYELRKCLFEFKSKFVSETAGIPTIVDCLKVLSKRCGGAHLTGSRTKNCIQIVYDKREVSEKCEGPPEEVVEILELYNRTNKLIKNILDKASQVSSSIQLVLEEEQKLKREVTKADPDGKLGPEPLKTTGENFIKLHKVPEYIDTIQKYTNKAFVEIMSGSKALFEET
ncbi:hypothetical protein Bpfe_010032 [Biomphalaria pfeifferi]|uniref:Uncharacterized protein n=1 Tax=Biomphalaria pfeifferi TaxID=112525 RepID=A0AAD8BVD1_BIOPF|nr:hypothetical protein Bpfe_010032 [Biomphalaria pfeifferi]